MKNFDNYLYYPAIRTRPAELLGYRHLSNEQKDELLPLVTLGSWPRQDGLGESMAQTEQALDGRPYMLDLTREATYQLSEIRGLLDDGEAHASLVTVLFRHLAPAVLCILARLERAFDLGRPFHELVEVHRTELAANHPEIAAFGHHRLRYSAA